MRVSSSMVEIEREVKLPLDTNSGPYYFGPRLDFNYAVLGLRSPDQFFLRGGIREPLFPFLARRMSFKFGKTIGFKR